MVNCAKTINTFSGNSHIGLSIEYKSDKTGPWESPKLYMRISNQARTKVVTSGVFQMALENEIGFEEYVDDLRKADIGGDYEFNRLRIWKIPATPYTDADGEFTLFEY